MTKLTGEPINSGSVNFMTKYCQRHLCLPEDYATHILWSCMHRVSLPLARMIWSRNPDFFRSDLHLIHEIKAATSFAQVRETVKFLNNQPANMKFVRHTLKVRVSRSKLLKLAAAVLGENIRKSASKPAK